MSTDHERVRVRRAGIADAAALTFFFDAILRKDYFLRRGQLREILTDAYHDVYVADIDGVLVGIAIVTRGARLINALVHPAYRGLGIGRAIIDHSGATEVRAKIDMSSGDPRPFYRAAGFRSTGEFNAKGNIELMRRTICRVRPSTTAVNIFTSATRACIVVARGR